MRLEAKTLLDDARRALARIGEFTAGKSFHDYASDVLLRSAVERQFEIIGEALNRLAKLDKDVVEQITDYRRIIAFRNILIHGYDVIENSVVWDIVQQHVPVLAQHVIQLLDESASHGGSSSGRSS